MIDDTLVVNEPIWSVREYVRKYFQGTNGFDKEAFASLLDAPYDFLTLVVDRLGFAAMPLLDGYFPADWGSWRNLRPEPRCEEVSRVLHWTVFKLHYHSTRLSAALSARNAIEDLLITGNYESAKRALHDFDNAHGVSLWGLATYFRLCELSAGTGFTRSELLRFTNPHRPGRKAKKHKWSNFLASILSLKCELDVTTLEFTDALHVVHSADSTLPDYALHYLRYRLLSQIPGSTSALIDILHQESKHSLLDLYDTTLVILSQVALIRLRRDVAAPLMELHNDLVDPSLSAILFQHLHAEVACDRTQYADCWDAALYAYHGNFDSALHSALRVLEQFPRFFLGYHMAGLSAAHLGKETAWEEIPSRPARDLVKAVFDWYSAFSDRNAALESLRHKARLYSGTVLGWGIQDFIDASDGAFDRIGGDRISPLSSPCPLPHHALLHSAGESGRILAEISPAIEQGFTTASIAAIAGGGSEECFAIPTDEVTTPRYLHLGAVNAAAHDRFMVAAKMLASLREDHIHYYAVRPETQVLEASCLFEVNDHEQAARLTAELYAINSRSLPPMQLRRFLPLVLDDTRDYDKGNIGWALIAAALLDEQAPGLTSDRVHDFVSDFIESQGFSLPTDLLAHLGPSLSRVTLAFLRDCCTPEIMESSIWIESQKQLLTERLVLCERIRTTLPNPPIGIDGEIGHLMRKVSILEITQRVERSKVYVDIDRIKERIPESLSDVVQRLLLDLAISNQDLTRSLRLLGMPTPDGGTLVLLSVDRGEELFRLIVSKLRELYLFSPELGLDANLSQTIRHGPIISGIRSLFDRSQFVTRTTVGGLYEPNNHWSSVLSDSDNRSGIERAFAQLSLSVDNFIRRIREDEIQIRTPDHPKGLLNYDFTDAETAAAYRAMEHIDDVDDVYDAALAVLKGRTDDCLGLVREKVRGEWQTELMGMLTSLQTQVEAIVDDDARCSQLRSAIIDCRTEINRGLERIAEWFTLEDRREHKPFSIGLLVKTMEDIAHKAGQSCATELKCGGAGDCQIRGRYFRPLWDLLFILFDNALKHSGLNHTTIAVDTDIQHARTVIGVANDLADGDMTVLKETILQLNVLSLDEKSDLSKLRSEGGSGIAKLHKIVRYEIGEDEAEYGIVLQLTSDSRFRVEIEIGKGIANEGVCG